MVFSQQVNIVYEFQKHVFEAACWKLLLGKIKSHLPYSHLFQSLQNALFLVSVTLMQMSCCPLTN